MQRINRLTLLVFLVLFLGAGCNNEQCTNDAPAIRLELELGQGLDGSKMTRLKVTLTVGGKTRLKDVLLNGQLADGETSLELVLGAFAAGGYTAIVEVRALDGAGQVLASARASVAGGADECLVVPMSLTNGDLTDGGPPPQDGPRKDVPVLDRGKPDAPGPNKDIKTIDDGKPKLDKGKPVPDKSKPVPDKSKPVPDKSKPNPDLPVGPCKGKADGTTCPYGKCLNGSCCLGCINGKTCYSGTGLSACGKGGVSCNTCTSNNACMDPKCASTGKCTLKAKTNGTACTGGKCASGSCCKGCIDANGTCQTGSSTNVCGQAGATCQKCKSNSECNNPYCSSSGTCGSTTAPSGQACVGGKCHKGNCCKGCIDAYYCQAGTSMSQCGTAGVTCVACSTSHPCKTASCGPPCNYTPKPKGTPCPTGTCSSGGVCNCSSDNDCGQNPAGYFCKTNAICGCTKDTHCPQGKTCKTSTGFCG